MLRYFPLSVTHLVVLGSFEEGCTPIERTTRATEEEMKKLVRLVTGQSIKTITRIGYDVTIVLITSCQSFVSIVSVLGYNKKLNKLAC